MLTSRITTERAKHTASTMDWIRTCIMLSVAYMEITIIPMTFCRR